MIEYKKLYLVLWNGITDAIEHIEEKEYFTAKQRLIKAQQDAEDIFINSEDGPPATPVPTNKA